MGVICSIILFAILFLYSVQKSEVLLSRDGVDIYSATMDSNFDSDYAFSAKQGLKIAVGFHH